MGTRDDVRRIALSLPATEKRVDRFAFSVRNKGKHKDFVWVWMERIDPKKPRVPNPGVIAARVASLDVRQQMIADDPKKFFTEPHYAGFPAVLVRLAEVSVADLERLIAEAWRCQASVDLVNLTRAQTPEADTRRRGSRTRRSTSRPATARATRRRR